MSDKIVINVKPYVGEYDFDIEDEPLTTNEWRWVKKISGYLPLTIEDGWKGADPDLFLAFAVVALIRAGRVDKSDALTVAERLGDAPFDGAAISYVGDPQEADPGDPPAEPAETPETEQPPTSGGESSKPTSDPSVDDQSPTTPPAWERSATSSLLSSAT